MEIYTIQIKYYVIHDTRDHLTEHYPIVGPWNLWQIARVTNEGLFVPLRTSLVSPERSVWNSSHLMWDKYNKEKVVNS